MEATEQLVENPGSGSLLPMEFERAAAPRRSDAHRLHEIVGEELPKSAAGGSDKGTRGHSFGAAGYARRGIRVNGG